MLAILGHMVTASGYRFGGNIFGVPYDSIKPGIGALYTLPPWGIAQIVLFVGLLEFGYGYQEEAIAAECKYRYLVL